MDHIPGAVGGSNTAGKGNVMDPSHVVQITQERDGDGKREEVDDSSGSASPEGQGHYQKRNGSTQGSTTLTPTPA